MKINKAYKFRLYPTNEQKILINKTFGCTRLVYNYYLNKNIYERIIIIKIKKEISTVATIGI